MDIEELLIKTGMDEKEAKVYVALLDLGNEKVHEIAKKAGIKRPTAYVVLEQLYAKNYVIKTYHNKKVCYSAEKPDILLRALQEKYNLLEQSLPLLQARMATSKIRPKIRIYEARSGIEQVYDEIHKSASVSFFGSVKYLSDEFMGKTDTVRRIIKSKDIHVRDLLTDDPKDIEFGLKYNSDNYQGRVLPKEFDLYIDGAVYDDKIAIISIKKELFAVVIESKEVADTFRSLFELAWKVSMPLDKYVKQHTLKDLSDAKK